MDRITKTLHYLFLPVLGAIFSLNTAASMPDLDWYEIANQDGISILTTKTDLDVIPFKASGEIQGDINLIVDILLDHKKKNLWSPKLKSVKIHKALPEDEFIFSEYYSTPWPASDREFLLKGKIKQISTKKYALTAYSIQEGGQLFNKFRDEDHVQAEVHYLNIFLEEKRPGVTEIQFEFHGDMKGWMPVWLMNLIQKKWPLRFIQGLRAQI